ncbi:MAG: sugar-binding protein [Bryobacteraceae bacterium]
MTKTRLLAALTLAATQVALAQNRPPRSWDKSAYPIDVPFLEKAPVIDGDLAEWKYLAFHDGVWDIFRVMHAPWYDPSLNRLTDHGNEPPPEDDLAARYYTAWDKKYLYFGAEVRDNVNDVEDPAHDPTRWFFKDAICWFIEAPRRNLAKSFGRGDNAFCFVIDVRKPSYGAWWRHGDATRNHVEEAIPKTAVDYVIRLNPWGRSKGDFVLEARVAMAATLGRSDPGWTAPKTGDEYGMEIVHTDPDGGGYGGHLLIYGAGDNDATWGAMKLTGPQRPVQRRPE